MVAAELAPLRATANPYPGLRAFEPEESHLFYGREQQTQSLLDRLSQKRFLAVVGSSGSGKSSLVRAGLVPALERGFLTGTSSRWRIAIMRPGNAPLDALTEEMAKCFAEAAWPLAELRERIGESSRGLVQVLREVLTPVAVKAPAEDAPPPVRESLLLVVDQFEEIFRFRRESLAADGGAEAALFVSALLQASAAIQPAVYVVLTMRSDFLGDCSEFNALPEALNEGQYLVPRLTADQLRAAITRPLRFGGATIAPRLTEMLLRDIGGSSDQLPVLQHALSRTYATWERTASGPIDLEHYEPQNSVAHALNHHAEEIWAGFSEEEQNWTERIFRCITKTQDGKAIRRPLRLGRIYDVTGAATDATQAIVRKVLGVFLNPANSLLVTPHKGELTPDAVIDISHESLIRNWERLKAWAKAEAMSVEWYQELSGDAMLYAAGEVNVWAGRALARADEYRKSAWNEAWARQAERHGGASFANTMAFIDAGLAEEKRKLEEKQAAERREKELLEARLAAETEAKTALAQRLEAEAREKAELEGRLAAQRRARKWGLATVGLLVLTVLSLVAWLKDTSEKSGRIRSILMLVDSQARSLEAANTAAAEARKSEEQLRELQAKLAAGGAGANQADLRARIQELEEARKKSDEERRAAEKKAAKNAKDRLRVEKGGEYQNAPEVADNSELQRAREEIAGLQRDLKAVQAKLTEVEAARDNFQKQVGSLQAALGARTMQSKEPVRDTSVEDDLRTRLTAAETELARMRQNRIWSFKTQEHDQQVLAAAPFSSKVRVYIEDLKVSATGKDPNVSIVVETAPFETRLDRLNDLCKAGRANMTCLTGRVTGADKAGTIVGTFRYEGTVYSLRAMGIESSLSKSWLIYSIREALPPAATAR